MASDGRCVGWGAVMGNKVEVRFAKVRPHNRLTKCIIYVTMYICGGNYMDYYVKETENLIEVQKKVRRTVAEQYIKVRKEKKLTQEDLAARMDVSRPNISRFESGEYNTTIDMLVKMADCLGMELVIELRKIEEK